MKKHLPFIGGTLLMTVPTILFVFIIVNQAASVSFGAFAAMIAVCLLCLIVGANVALDDNTRRCKREG